MPDVMAGAAGSVKLAGLDIIVADRLALTGVR